MEDNLTSADPLSYTTNGSWGDLGSLVSVSCLHNPTPQLQHYISLFHYTLMIKKPLRFFREEINKVKCSKQQSAKFFEFHILDLSVEKSHLQRYQDFSFQLLTAV